MNPSPIHADRLHALDNLRATMMWLGIVLHVAVIHLEGPSPLPWHDDRSTPVADLLMAFIHAFRMPVFFILAGFFVALLVQRRGTRAMVRNRLQRLAVPFAVFWPPIYAACGVLALLFLHRMERGTWGIDRSLLLRSDVPQGPSTMHLWFLWMLLWFSVLTVPALWLWQRLPGALARALSGGFGRLGQAPWGFMVLALPLAGVGALYDDGLVRPSGHFLPPLAEWVHNGLFYVFGIGLYQHQKTLFPLYLRRWPVFAVAGLVCFMATGGLYDLLARPPRRGAPALLGRTGLQRVLVALELRAHRAVYGAPAAATHLADLPGRQFVLGVSRAHAADHRHWRPAVRPAAAGAGQDAGQCTRHHGHLPGELPRGCALHAGWQPAQWQAPCAHVWRRHR